MNDPKLRREPEARKPEAMSTAQAELNVVTGAFGYTGRYITRRLLDMGKRVITLTGHPDRPGPFGDRVPAYPFRFSDPAQLTQTLAGATTLYHTYWVRFPRGRVTFEQAVENTKTLITAAEAAGIRRIVHISITNASETSPLPYFRGKGLVEQAIMESRLSYAIIRPTVVFGAEDILLNNIAYLLRRSPVFFLPGRGAYRVQPVYVEDVAELAVRAGESQENMITDAVGPEVYTFDQLVRLIAGQVGSRTKVLHMPPGVVLFLSRLVGYAVRDVVLTGDEVKGLMSSLLVSAGPPTGKTLFSSWLEKNAAAMGTRYASELDRHYRSAPVNTRKSV